MSTDNFLPSIEGQPVDEGRVREDGEIDWDMIYRLLFSALKGGR